MNIVFTPYSNYDVKNSILPKRNKAFLIGINTNSLAPLRQDSVSFCGKKKPPTKTEDIEEDFSKAKDFDSTDRSSKISYQMGKDINKECQPDLIKLMQTLKIGLKSVIESDQHPDLPILRGEAGIHGRVKKAESIMQKVPPRKLRQKNEIFKMGDIVGVRLVLKSSSHNDLDLVFKELGKMVTSGKLKVIEVENYRLTPRDSYVSQKTLDNFETTCNKVGQYPEITSKPRESGYTAIHITVELPDGKLAEIQIMGIDMERVKDIEDFFYKKRHTKTFDDKYLPIANMLNRVMGKTKKDKETGKISYENLDDFQTATLDRYIRDSYAHARAIPPKHSKQKYANYYLPIPYSLPQELDFSNIQRLKDVCDYQSKKSKKK